MATIQKISLDVRSKKANVPNVCIIRTPKGTIVRTNNQFLTDLQDSLLLPKNVDDISHPTVIEAARDLIHGNVSLDNVDFYKAGSKYILDETSSVITDPNHADYGKYEVGEEYERKSDGAMVNGFLTLSPSNDVNIANKTAAKLAMAFASFVPASETAKADAVSVGGNAGDDDIAVVTPSKAVKGK